MDDYSWYDSLPTKCKTCPYRGFNDDWCVIMQIDCYKQAVRDDDESD